MIRTGIIKDGKNTSSQKAFLQNRFMILLFAVFLSGMIYGAISVQSMDKDLIQSADFITQGFIASRAEQSIIKTFFSSFCSSGIILLLIFLFGFSSIGQPISFFALIFRGLGLGFSMGYLYFYYGWKGAAYCVVLILPHVLVSTLSIIIGAKESIRFSNLLFAQFKPNNDRQIEFKSVKMYISKFLILLLLIFVAAFIDSIFTLLFARFFILS